jgi:hypothetical protein
MKLANDFEMTGLSRNSSRVARYREPRGLALVLIARFCAAVHRGAFIGSRPARARPSGQKYVDKLPRERLPASSPFQSVTPSQVRDSATFKHIQKRHRCSVVTEEKGQKPECFCRL